MTNEYYTEDEVYDTIQSKARKDTKMMHYMKEWLSMAERRRDGIKIEAERARNKQARAVMQRQCDELDAQIDVVKCKLNESKMSTVETHHESTME